MIHTNASTDRVDIFFFFSNCFKNLLELLRPDYAVINYKKDITRYVFLFNSLYKS